MFRSWRFGLLAFLILSVAEGAYRDSRKFGNLLGLGLGSSAQYRSLNTVDDRNPALPIIRNIPYFP